MDKTQVKLRRPIHDWYHQQEIMEEYGSYECYDYKWMAVNLNHVKWRKEIDVNKLEEEDRTLLLEKEGMKESFFEDYHFIYLPDGTYLLNKGDPKLLLTAMKLGIQKILTHVSILLPHEQLLENTITSLEKMTLQRNDYQDRLDEVNLECRLNYKAEDDIPPFIKKIRTELYDNLTWVKDKRNFLLHNEAKRLELLPDRPRLKVIIKKQGN